MMRRMTNGNESQLHGQKNGFFNSQYSVSTECSSKTEKSPIPQGKNVITSRTNSQSAPPTHFFTQLKQEEHKQFTSKRRRRFDYKENYSVAISLPYSNSELKRAEDNQSKLLKLSKHNLLEHSHRRVDLFFYTLIAYYNTKIIPVRGHTSLQHGRGRHVGDDTSITEACHSSFTPSLVDNTIYQNSHSKKKRKGLLCGTHLMDNLNATVELPSFVNDLDDVLEKMCGNKCFAILREVSLGTINPIEGLNQFLKEIQRVLINIRQQIETNNCSNLIRHSLIGKKEDNIKLINLVLRGTLRTTFSEQTQCVIDEYIQMLLRMSEQEKELLKKNGECNEALYLNKIIEMQDEILQTKNTPLRPQSRRY